MTITATALTGTEHETRRNAWGQYLVMPPGGTKEIGYVRVTTVAKTLDDGGGLIPWKATATVVGKSRRPGLAAQWAALISKHSDPWYSSTESKAECKRLVEECATAGGSTDRAEIGTALHALCEQMDRGLPLTGVTPDIQADLDAYKATVAAAGITFDAAGIEAIVVLDEWRVAGTADRLSTLLPDGRRVVADLKTGANLDYSWQSIAVQLAAYANADSRYVQHKVGGERFAMPALDRTTGLVIHLPAGEARCVLHTVDLVAGWEAFERSMWTRGWRKRRDLSAEYKPPVTISGVSLGAPEAAGPEPSTGPAAAPTPADLASLAFTIAGWPTDVKARLARLWPSTLPTPRQVRDDHADWNADDVPALQAVLLEAQAPWTILDRTLDSNPQEDRWTTTNSPPASGNSTSSESTSSTQSTGSTTQPNGSGTHPKTSPPPPTNSSNRFADTLNSFTNLPADDGGPLDPRALEALLADAVDVKMVINMWLVEATAAGCNWNPRTVGTVRSFEQARAARALATMWDDSPAGELFVRLILEHATGRPT